MRHYCEHCNTKYSSSKIHNNTFIHKKKLLSYAQQKPFHKEFIKRTYEIKWELDGLANQNRCEACSQLGSRIKRRHYVNFDVTWEISY